MNYQQTIDFLYDTLPMFSRMGSAAFKKDLTNTLLLCERLGNPQHRFKSIHVAGTNGKGSVSHMLAAIFQTAGYRTGLYTSPHLYDFRERIRINGILCDPDFIVDFVERIKPSLEQIQPSFFEITVAMAFDYFARRDVDIAIIEVGLGGRLDSTNVIRPVLSVITNIGWDHMNLLGNTLEEIASEKAGIIKEKIPVVVGERRKETEDIFRKTAAAKQAPLYFAEDRFHISGYQLSGKGLEVWVRSDQPSPARYLLDLPGIYQTRNILTVLQAVQLLAEWNIAEHVETALENVRTLTGLQGRWEVIQEDPTVVLEVAHNQDGIEQMVRHIEQTRYNELHLIIGMVRDKEVDRVLRALPATANYYFTQAHIPRALDAVTLQAKASVFSLQGSHYEDVNTALKEALNRAVRDDLIVVCGSIFLVGEVNRMLVAQQA